MTAQLTTMAERSAAVTGKCWDFVKVFASEQGKWVGNARSMAHCLSIDNHLFGGRTSFSCYVRVYDTETN
jgi:hypothetical protein